MCTSERRGSGAAAGGLGAGASAAGGGVAGATAGGTMGDGASGAGADGTAGVAAGAGDDVGAAGGASAGAAVCAHAAGVKNPLAQKPRPPAQARMPGRSSDPNTRTSVNRRGERIAGLSRAAK